MVGVFELQVQYANVLVNVSARHLTNAPAHGQTKQKRNKTFLITNKRSVYESLNTFGLLKYIRIKMYKMARYSPKSVRRSKHFERDTCNTCFIVSGDNKYTPNFVLYDIATTHAIHNVFIFFLTPCSIILLTSKSPNKQRNNVILHKKKYI